MNVRRRILIKFLIHYQSVLSLAGWLVSASTRAFNAALIKKANLMKGDFYSKAAECVSFFHFYFQKPLQWI